MYSHISPLHLGITNPALARLSLSFRDVRIQRKNHRGTREIGMVAFRARSFRGEVASRQSGSDAPSITRSIVNLASTTIIEAGLGDSNTRKNQQTVHGRGRLMPDENPWEHDSENNSISQLVPSPTMSKEWGGNVSAIIAIPIPRESVE